MPTPRCPLSPLCPPVFLRLFADPARPEFLLDLLNHCLELELEQLQFLPGGEEALCLRAWDQEGRRHHLQVAPGLTREGQPGALEGLLRFYLARFQARQPDAEPCLGLHLRGWSSQAHPERYHLRYRWRERRSEQPLQPHLVLHALELPAFSRLCQHPSSPGEHWLYFLAQAEHGEEAPEGCPEWVLGAWERLRVLGEEPGLLAQSRAHRRNQEYEARGQARPAAPEGAQRAAGQREMLAEVVAYRLDRALEEEERRALDAHLASIALDGIRAYSLEASREELEIWLQRLTQAALGS